MQLIIAARDLAICRLPAGSELPGWVRERTTLVSVTWTTEELSIVCPAYLVPPGVRCERGWAALKVVGPLDFALTGILASLLAPLAAQAIPVFALSTFDTDYILVREAQVSQVQAVLVHQGHEFL